jgi:hypothetical protein
MCYQPSFLSARSTGHSVIVKRSARQLAPARLVYDIYRSVPGKFVTGDRSGEVSSLFDASPNMVDWTTVPRQPSPASAPAPNWSPRVGELVEAVGAAVPTRYVGEFERMDSSGRIAIVTAKDPNDPELCERHCLASSLRPAPVESKQPEPALPDPYQRSRELDAFSVAATSPHASAVTYTPGGELARYIEWMMAKQTKHQQTLADLDRPMGEAKHPPSWPEDCDCEELRVT